MKISLNWLKRYIDLDLSPDEIADILTMTGLEVEDVQQIETIKGGLKGVVVGEVITCEKHPNADKLSVTTVNVGNDSPHLPIVCGAPNVAAGQKVAVALPGTQLFPAKGKPLIIKKSKIRGEISEGMICSEAELNLSEDHSGILILPEDLHPGTHLAAYFDVKEDFIFEIGLTPNRSDATSHMGVARDLVAFMQVNKEFPGDLKVPETSSFKVDMHTGKIKVDVQNLGACPRYSSLMLTDIEVGPSPEWLKSFLRAIDVRPINNIVDITNFILHETGQPLHAFDAEQISEGKVIINTLPGGTAFTTLDGVTRTLHRDDLMICNGEAEGMCIAGVFGGLGTGVTQKTKTIFLESAYFHSAWIRKTSTRHNLRTDAARIFEKGADPNITVYALKRAAIMMRDLANAVICSDIIDIYPVKIEKAEIHLRYENVRHLLGIKIEKDVIHQVLRALDMEIEPVDQESIMVHVPTNKSDVTREADLIEEILRIYGFNKVEVNDEIVSKVHFKKGIDKHEIRKKLSNLLSNSGYSEIMGMSLVDSRWYQNHSISNAAQLVCINNTSNIHLDALRPEMLISGIQSVQYNHYRQNLNLKLYEIGRSYSTRNGSFSESEFLTIFHSGSQWEESWKNGTPAKGDFFDIKHIVHDILIKSGVDFQRFKTIDDDPRFSYGLVYNNNGNELVRFGAVSNEVVKNFNLKSEVFYAEFLLDSIYPCVQKNKYIRESGKYPSIRRDLALVLDKNIQYYQIEALAKKFGGMLLREINLFDIYEDVNILGEGKKSYALWMKFADDTKTLQDEEVESIIKIMVEKFETELNAVIRK
ncbi:MAG TPA: phenylalanine--tRNA ligase subunit beta [Saprospiraceae bacterium]|nr:phenylalanine--tRNA ligase subunit beta [Saprospiraceae bacterium]